MTTSSELGPWRCPRCDADRAAEDDFCGRCGARRPRPEAAAPGPGGGGGASGEAPGRSVGFPVRRALVLNGIIVAAVVAAVVLGSNGGPGSIAFEPPTWRCDGTERAWIAPIPARAFDLRIEWRTGGPEGVLHESLTTTREELGPYGLPDGSYRVTTTDRAAPECSLDPGPYTMALRDAANGSLLAWGEVELAP